MLDKYLDDLAQRIDEDEEQALWQAWRDFTDDKVGRGVFVPPNRTPKPPAIDWPQLNINDALHDPQLMVLDEFRKKVSEPLAGGSNQLLGVRCNYGVSIMTSQLGCEVVEMPREQGNTPTTLALGGVDAIHRAIDRGVPDLRAGQGADVFDTAELFLDVLQRWPVLGRWVDLFHPDAQGPMDNAELAWGSDIFLAFYDTPDLVGAFLDLMTDHYLAFMRKWYELVPPRDPDYATHWGFMHRGRIMLREDSLMNLSPDIFVNFVREREQRCLSELGGGAMHYCGRGDHFIEPMSQMQSLYAINLSQPHLNDMDAIYRNTIDKGILIIDLDSDWAAKADRDLLGRVNCRSAAGASVPAGAS